MNAYEQTKVTQESLTRMINEAVTHLESDTGFTVDCVVVTRDYLNSDLMPPPFKVAITLEASE